MKWVKIEHFYNRNKVASVPHNNNNNNIQN